MVVANVAQSSGTQLTVVHHRIQGPHGETVLDPVFAELLFVARWRRLPLELVPSPYPTMAALGTLPCATGMVSTGSSGSSSGKRGVVPRQHLLKAVAAFDADGYGRGQTADDEAYCALLRHFVADGISAVLYCDDGVWEDFTRPALARSAPRGRGWSVAWSERRRQLQRPAGMTLFAMSAPGAPSSLSSAATGALGGPAAGDGAAASLEGRAARCSVALLELASALEALAERLGSGDCFADDGCVGGVCGSGAIDGLSALDACAFAHLSVLYSIPSETGSSLHAVVSRFPTLVHFCDRMEIRLDGTWPDPRSFLAGLAVSERPPAAAAFAAASKGRAASPSASGTTPRLGYASATSGSAPGARLRQFQWWESWGWSWGGRQRPPDSKAKRGAPPPQWYGVAFGVTTAVAIVTLSVCDWGPPPIRVLGFALAQAASGASRAVGGSSVSNVQCGDGSA